MEFTEFANIIYIRGYFKTKPEAMEKLFKGSVAEPGKVSVSKAAINGYLRGETISSLAITLINAGLSIDKMSSYIKSLYEKKHRGTPTYKERFGNQTYKDALYNQVKGKFVGITTDNMSEILATAFFTIIQDAANEKESEKASKPREASEIVLNFTMTNDEKRAILNLCELIYRKLQDIMHTVNDIDKKRQELKHIAHMLAEKIQKCKSIYKAGHLLKSKIRWRLKRNGTIREPKWMRMQRWKTYLEFGVKSLNNSIDKDCTKLQDYCMKIAKLLENKKNINPNIDKLYELAHKVSNDKHICPESIEYSRFFILVSDFQMIYDWLQRNIAKL